MYSPIYIIIPTFKRSNLTMRTLDSLCHCEFPDSYRGTIIIENGSNSNDLVDYINHLNNKYLISYRHTPEANKSHALNEIVRELPEPSLLIFFDDDVIIHPYTIKAYEKAAVEKPDFSYFGGCLLPDYPKEEPDAWLKVYLPASVKEWSKGSEHFTANNLYFLGANWACRQQSLSASGYFDGRFGPGGETGARGQETQMQRDLKKYGYKGLYVPNAIVWHYVPEHCFNIKWILQRQFAMSMAIAKQRKREGPVNYWKVKIINIIKLFFLELIIYISKLFFNKKRHMKFLTQKHQCLGFLAGLKSK